MQVACGVIIIACEQALRMVYLEICFQWQAVKS